MDAATLDARFENLVRYDQKESPFCDHFAHFSFSFAPGGPIGVGSVNPRSALATYQVSHAALQLWLIEANQLVAVQRQNLRSWPWLALESTQLGAVAIEARHLFCHARRAVSEFTLRNAGAEAITLAPCWLGMIAADDRRYMLHYFKGASDTPRVTFLEPIPGGIRGGLRNTAAGDLPEAGLQITALHPDITVWTGEAPYWADVTAAGGFAAGALKSGQYAFRATPLTLAPGQEVRYQFTIDVTLASYLAPGLRWPEPPAAPLDLERLSADNRSRFYARLRPETLPVTQGPALWTKTARARLALLRDGLRGLDGEFGDNIACLCTADDSDFSCSFFWDTLFSSVAIAEFDPEYARGAIRTAFVRHLTRDGSTPERKFNYSAPQRMLQQAPQSPIAAWVVTQYLARHDDHAFLAELYPLLLANHRFWELHSDADRDGLSEYRWSGQVCDNSPLWDDYASYSDLSGCGWIPPVASVALNSFLYWDATVMQRLALRLGLREDQEYFARRCTHLHDRLHDICYVPAERRYWDYNHHTGQHKRVKTFYMFWPLVCGLPVPEATARDLIEHVLLDPAQFFGAIPFPSVAYDEPAYQPAGYWRGKAWPHISYWLLATLVRYGYRAEADLAAQRILAWYSARNGFLENMTTDPAVMAPSGYPDYNWGCAAFYLIATGRYREENALS